MKASAIIRIVVFVLLFFILAGILIAGLTVGYFFDKFIPGIQVDSGEKTTTIQNINPTTFSSLNIDWAAGSVNITTGYNSNIIIKDTKDTNNRHNMVTEIDGGTLKIRYSSNTSFQLGGFSEKDLLIIVPKGWDCRNLEIKGFALNVDISGLSVNNLEINGASMDFTFRGSVDVLECNSGAVKMDVTCNTSPHRVSVDGAGCNLKLDLPKDCGFVLDPDGVAIEFNCALTYHKEDDKYYYGDEYCRIDVSGIGCLVTIPS